MNYIADSASSQWHECLVKIALLWGIVRAMHRGGAVDVVALWTLARARAEQADQPSCRTGLGLRIKPLGSDWLFAVHGDPARHTVEIRPKIGHRGTNRFLFG